MKGSKGISLPIEMIVIIAVAVLVLVVITAFFVGNVGSQTNVISDQAALTQGCTDLLFTYNCDSTKMSSVKISSYSATCGGKSGNTLEIACCKVGYTDLPTCAKLACRCP